ncbi:MAG: hypothetical protein WC485_00195 [Opitutaceae bacterium]
MREIIRRGNAYLFAIGGVAAYVVPAIIMLIYLINHEAQRPIIGAVLWPLRLIKLLLGGG